MSSESKAASNSLDIVKWLLALVFLAAAVVGNIYFNEIAEVASIPQSLILQVLAVVLLMVISGLLALSTSRGQAFRVLLKEANTERRKVVWPTRQETIQTTIIVVVAVFITGLVLWGIDSVLGWLTKLLIG